MDKILITGGAGFIGGFLAAMLAKQGHSVHLIDNLARGRRDRFLTRLLAEGKVELLERDLRRADALDDVADDVTHIFHFAAIVGVPNVLERPYATLRDNVLLVERALACARRQRSLQRFVFASTSEVYGGSLELLHMPIPTPEDTPLALPSLTRPRTSYMLSKLYGEAMVQHAGVAFTIVRPHNVYGPRMGMSHVVPQLLRQAHCLADGGVLPVSSVDHRRTFCFVDDAVAMIERAARAPGCSGQVLNVGSQSPEVSIGELAMLVQHVVGKRLVIDPQPATPGSPTRRCPDLSRLTELTGCRARVGLEDGLRRTYEWYRAAVFDGDEREVAR